MNEPIPSFFTRLSLAFKYFFRTLADVDFAVRVMLLLSGEPTEAPARPAAPAGPAFREAQPEAALQLLGLLQQEGRLVDFLQEDVTGFSDTDVGAAARVVHQGCRKALTDHFRIVPIRTEQ